MIDQQKQLKTFNIAMYSMINGLWDLFGDSAFATVNSLGDQMLARIEKELGRSVNGQSVPEVLEDISGLIANELGMAEKATVTMGADGQISLACQKCFLTEATGWLEAEGVQPFACAPMNIAGAAMRKNLKKQHRLKGRRWDPVSETCTIEFQAL